MWILIAVFVFLAFDVWLSYRGSKKANRDAKEAREQYERISAECDRNLIWLNQWSRDYDGTLRLPKLKESKCKGE